MEAIADAVMARVEAKLDAFKDTLTANNQALVDQIKALFSQQGQAPIQPSVVAPPAPQVPAPAPIPEVIMEIAEGRH